LKGGSKLTSPPSTTAFAYFLVSPFSGRFDCIFFSRFFSVNFSLPCLLSLFCGPSAWNWPPRPVFFFPFWVHLLSPGHHGGSNPYPGTAFL